ncbi:MAG: tyrosine-type recombinase/integrase [Vampirovibrionales bacterium]|nr:tyrosine-type recombinase/integrase [Vampirovibrionales bacterium]
MSSRLPLDGANRQRLLESVEPFLSHLAVNRNLSSQTIRAYQSDLALFCQWLSSIEALPSAGNPALSNPTLLNDMPGQFITWLGQKGLSRSTLARKLSCLKTYFKYLMKEGIFTPDALPLRFHRPKLPRKLPEFLNVDDIQGLIRHAEKLSETSNSEQSLALRNLAIVETLFSSGIRVSELAQLTFEQINWEEGELRIFGKGARERIAFVSQKALKALMLYKSVWADLSQKPFASKHPVFLNYRGEALNVRSIRRILDQLAEAAGLGRHIHPHVFRHTFATHLLNKGVDLRVVQELLGHVSIRSTQIYTHLSTERLRSAYLKAHPRAKQTMDQG